LLDQARSSSRRYLFVQGLADRKNHYIDQANVEVVSFLNTADLNRAILSAEVVVCRSGYSSIMDLCRLGKKALLIPTPGQTEQVYLAEMLSAAGYFYIMDQDQLDLDTGIDQALARTGAPDYENSLSWLSDYLVTEKNG
ncbi:MAG: glycosyltransferase, partial [Bacteroidota bacterium]